MERAQLDVKDGAFVAIDAEGQRIHIPVGGVACLMLEPGARISHAAIALAAQVGTLVTWVGEGGVRLYSAGQPGGARADRLLWQAKIALDDGARLKVVRKMYALRFGEDAPARRSLDQLRGIEGQRVRHAYLFWLNNTEWTGSSGNMTRGLGQGRHPQPLPFSGHELPARTVGGRSSSGRLCPSDRLSAYRQTTQLCL